MLVALSNLKSKKFSWLKKRKDFQYGFLFTLSYLWITNAEKAFAGCVGWLCGPKQTLTDAFPGGSAVMNTGFALMQGVIIAILVGMGAVVINKIASREDYGAPMAAFFGTVLALLAINYLAGYVVGTAVVDA